MNGDNDLRAVQWFDGSENSIWADFKIFEESKNVQHPRSKSSFKVLMLEEQKLN